MNSFFDNLEDSSAFFFYFDDVGKPVQVKNTDYILYEGDIFPMVMFGNELRALNDYCYKIVTATGEELTNIKERLVYYSKEEQRFSFDCMEFTPYEMKMLLAIEQSQWEWIADVTAGHLVILLYSFLEKTLKYVYKWFAEEKLITFRYMKKVPKVYFWLYHILEVDEKTFQEQYRDVYSILDKCRKIRNHFAHDNLEGVEEPDKDSVYERKELQESFRLVDFITIISIIFYEIEKVYKEKRKQA